MSNAPHLKRRLSGQGFFSIATEMEDLGYVAIPSVLLLFDKVLSRKRLLQLLVERVVALPHNYRFRSQIVDNLRKFESIDEFVDSGQIGSHVKSIRLASDDHLNEALSQEIFRPFSLDGPQWEVIIFENFSRGWLLYFRNHHCIGDGVSLCQTYLKLANEKSEYERIMLEKFGHFFHGCCNWFKHWLWILLGLLPTLLAIFCNLLTGPEPAISQSGIDHRPFISRRKDVNFLWNQSFHIPTLKKIGRRFGGMTINDVFVALIGHSLSSYFEIEEGDSKTIRMAIPINIRRQVLASEPSNRFGVSFCPVELAPMSWEQRCTGVKKATKKMKKWPIQFYSYFFSKISPWMPIKWLRKSFRTLTSKYQTFNLSNVFGSPIQLSMDDSNLIDMVFFVPTPGTALGFSALSYGDWMTLGLVTDRTTMKDPELIVEGIINQYEELVQEVFDEDETMPHEESEDEEEGSDVVVEGDVQELSRQKDEEVVVVDETD